MSKEIFCKLAEELERDPTDEEVADAMADLIDSSECPCEDASRANCTDCQDLPVWYFDHPKVTV